VQRAVLARDPDRSAVSSPSQPSKPEESHAPAPDPRDPQNLRLKRVASVAEGACTVLGDHPEESTDSRTFGPVQLGNILGRAVFRYGPITRVGWLW